MKATKFMRENTQCPISQWVNSEIAKHSHPSNLGEQCNAKIAIALLKRFKSKLSKSAKDPMAFTKSPKFHSMNSTKSATGDCYLSVLWAGEWFNSTGKTFQECIAKMGRLLK